MIIDRRAFVAGMGATLIAPRAGFALTESNAKALVGRLIDEINGVIASGKPEPAMYKDFERIFARYSDTSYIAAYALGVDGRRATKAQKKAFSKAFQAYVSRKYGRRFREFIGGKLEMEGVKKTKKWYEVSTTAYLKGEAPFNVTFYVSDRSGKDLFFNLYIEGINMLLTERTEIGAMLDKRKGDLDRLIADLSKAG